MMALKKLNIRDLGAAGDGISDDGAVIQKALDLAAGCGEVIIPDGNYLVRLPLCVSSGTVISSDKNARIIFSGELPKHRGDFLIKNKNPDTGDSDITIKGGIWDGNYDGKNNKKAALFDMNGFCGATMNFINVKNLKLLDFSVVNSTAFFIRMGKIDGFVIEDILFTADHLTGNQDGVHLSGECRNGRISRIKATRGQTNDDLIALNADDCVTRVDNLDLVRGPIENITIEDIEAENCFTFTRMASVTSPIRNISFKNVNVGCRMYFLNADGLRYCATPIIKEEDYPEGTGCIENVTMENVRIKKTSGNDVPLFALETRFRNFRMKDTEILPSDNTVCETILARNIVKTKIAFTDKHKKMDEYVEDKNGVLRYKGNISSLAIDSEY